MPDWRWSAPTHNYRDLETGRFVSGAQVHSWSAAAGKASADAVGTMADMLAEGKLSVHDWTLLMRDEIKDAYIQQYVLAKGGLSQMTQRDWSSIGGMLGRDQYAYLDRFAREIADGKVSPAQIKRRAAMYVRSSREAFERGNARVHEDATEIRWAVSPEIENCSDCLEFQAMGWQKREDDPYHGAIPGSGNFTQCGVNCGCHFEYR